LCESEPERAFENNVVATRNVVAVARELLFPVAHISTDAVFDGSASTPRIETDAVGPVSIYGMTKLLAEEAVAALDRHCIFRVSVLFGPGKDNFVDKGPALFVMEALIRRLLTSTARPPIRWMPQAKFLR
jgi:dTDP-4-dehydrorhamnose reductase